MIDCTTSTKVCTVCGQRLSDTDEFFPIYKVRGKRYRRNACRPCWRLGRKAHSDATRDQDRVRRHIWKAANPDKVAAEKKRHHERHRETDLARSKRWADANLDHAREVARAGYYANREDRIQKAMIHTVKRMARKKNLPDTFTDADWVQTLDYWDYACAICGRTANENRSIAMDHWIPLTDPKCPGTVPENIIPLCHGLDGCNNSKGNRNPVKWLHRKLGADAESKLIEILKFFEWLQTQPATLPDGGQSRAH